MTVLTFRSLIEDTYSLTHRPKSAPIRVEEAPPRYALKPAPKQAKLAMAFLRDANSFPYTRPGSTLMFHMVGYDSTLTQTVTWVSTTSDPNGDSYEGPGPLSNVRIAGRQFTDAATLEQQNLTSQLTRRIRENRTSFVLESGANNGGNVYGDFTLMYAALQEATTGGGIIRVRGAVTIAPNPSPEPYQLDGWSFVGTDRGTDSLVFADQCKIEGAVQFSNLTVEGRGDGSSTVDIDEDTTLRFNNCIVHTNPIRSPLISVTNNATLSLYLDRETHLGSASLTGPVVSVTGGSTLALGFEDARSSARDNSLTGDASVVYTYLSAGSIPKTLPSFVGTQNVPAQATTLGLGVTPLLGPASTSSVTITANTHAVLDATSGPITQTLPDPSTDAALVRGALIRVSEVSGDNPVDLTAPGGTTIGGQASVQVAAGTTVTLWYDGDNMFRAI